MKKVILFLVCLVGNIGFSQSVDDDPTLGGLKIGEIYSNDDKELHRSEENDYIIYERFLYTGKYAIYPYTERFKIVCIRKWDEEKIKDNPILNSFTKEELKRFSFHSDYEKGGSIISISMSVSIEEKDNAIDICNEIIDKYTIKFGTPTNISSNKNQKKWTWVGKKNIFVIKYITNYYPSTLTIQLVEKEYYLR